MSRRDAQSTSDVAQLQVPAVSLFYAAGSVERRTDALRQIGERWRDGYAGMLWDIAKLQQRDIRRPLLEFLEDATASDWGRTCKPGTSGSGRSLTIRIRTMPSSRACSTDRSIRASQPSSLQARRPSSDSTKLTGAASRSTGFRRWSTRTFCRRPTPTTWLTTTSCSASRWVARRAPTRSEFSHGTKWRWTGLVAPN